MVTGRVTTINIPRHSLAMYVIVYFNFFSLSQFFQKGNDAQDVNKPESSFVDILYGNFSNIL